MKPGSSLDVRLLLPPSIPLNHVAKEQSQLGCETGMVVTLRLLALDICSIQRAISDEFCKDI